MNGYSGYGSHDKTYRAKVGMPVITYQEMHVKGKQQLQSILPDDYGGSP